MIIITPDGRQIPIPDSSRVTKREILELFSDPRSRVDAVLAQRSGALQRLSDEDAAEPGDEILLLKFVGSTFRNQ